METEKNYKNIKIEEIGNSEIEIKVEINEKLLPEYWTKSLKKFSQNLEISGFRKGQVPEKMVIERVSEMVIWEEAIENALKNIYPEILVDHKIRAIGKPEVAITKSVPKTELKVKIKTAVFPEIKLADYKDLAKKKPEIKKSDLEVTDEELDKIIEMIRTERKSEDGKLPEFDENFVKSLGAFESVEDFKKKIKDNVKQDKAHKTKSEWRMSLMEDLITNSTIELPAILINSELDRMIFEFKGEIESAGMSLKDYLEKSKTTEEKMREDWRPKAEKKAKTQLILNKIAEDEHIQPDEQKVSQEVEKVVKEYPDADKERATIFITTILTNEAVFDFLEKSTENTKK